MFFILEGIYFSDCGRVTILRGGTREITVDKCTEKKSVMCFINEGKLNIYMSYICLFIRYNIIINQIWTINMCLNDIITVTKINSKQ